MTIETDNLIPLSGLQHMIFCERQAALIHVEKVWRDNALTTEGQHMHKRADGAGARRERRGDLVIIRGLALRSNSLGLIGRADVVEFHRTTMDEGPTGVFQSPEPGVVVPGLPGRWWPLPVEYKLGKPKSNRCDEVQVCAQAMCLEEMLHTRIEKGVLFYGKKKRRQQVVFDKALRDLVTLTSLRIHQLVSEGITPKAVQCPKCKKCSLLELCLPEGCYLSSAGDYNASLYSISED